MKNILLFLTFILLISKMNAQEHKEYFENGNLKVSGLLKDNKKVGEWKTFYKNGKLKYKGEYFNDKKDGEWEEYHENEKLITIFKYEKGVEISKKERPLFTDKCRATVKSAIEFYKNKMANVTDKGYAYVEFKIDHMKLSEHFNYSGYNIGNAKLAVSKYGGNPVIVNQKYNDEGKLYRIDIIQFDDYHDIVFIIEQMVKENCEGQYEIYHTSEELYLDEKLFNNNQEVPYDLDEVIMRNIHILGVED